MLQNLTKTLTGIKELMIKEMRDNEKFMENPVAEDYIKISEDAITEYVKRVVVVVGQVELQESVKRQSKIIV